MAYLAQLIDDVVANKFQLDKPKVTIGRRPDCTIQINDVAVSGEHAVISLEKSTYLEGSVDIFIEDLGSTNGSFVNGNPVQGKIRLTNDDVVRFAWNEFKLMGADSDDLEGTALILGL